MADCSWKVNRGKAWADTITAQQSQYEDLNLSDHNDAEINTALAIAAAVARIAKDLANMSMYEQRQWKMYERAHDRLRMMQKERREREQEELKEAALLLELHEAAEQAKKEEDASHTAVPYDPETDGFVFQVAEIKQFIRRHNRSAFAHNYQYGSSSESAQALRDFATAA